MPFASKAQQRLLFAKHPRIAQRWAKETPNMKDLPEKKQQKTAGEGMFFQKSAQPQGGRFFRDLPGRDNGAFHEKAAMTSYAPGEVPQGGGVNVSPGGMASGGSEAGGGMYGTGKPPKKKSGADRMRDVLGKTAAKTPDEWDADSGLPTGFHRAAREQPEALEAGGERFHSTEARPPDYGAAAARHGLVEGGSMKIPATSGHQMGKHAAPRRFLGTSYGLDKNAADAGDYAERAKGYSEQRLGEAGKSLRTFGRGVASKADEAVKGITQSPTSAAIAALVLGKMGLGAMKRVGGGALRAVGRRPAPSAAGQALGGLRKLITGR